MASSSSSILAVPLLPQPTDGLVTETSEEQERTEQVIRQLLEQYTYSPFATFSAASLPDLTHAQHDQEEPAHPQPPPPAAAANNSTLRLDRTAHIRWLTYLLNPLPTPYTSLDASRPWLLYWVTHSLALMGAELDADLKRRAVETIRSFWNEQTGGFGGGPGQMAHLAPTYAAVSALCYVGEPEDAWAWIDRQAVHDWMLSLKQPDGSFVMHIGGEVDVRGCYCALTTAVLLNILTPDLARNTARFVASCQTYEGGLASASHPLPGLAPPLGEAHGGYTYCALASYFALQASPSLTEASSSTSTGAPAPSLDLYALLRWASSMQGLPIEAGGFRGRTNKLVDGCYSWWCGGLFSMIEALLPRPARADDDMQQQPDLFNRVALQEYVLIAAQGPAGGLRDKPGKGVDAYHSCYNLSGLSAAQHHQICNDPDLRRELETDWMDVGSLEGFEMIKSATKETSEQANARMRDIFVAALSWKTVEGRKIIVGLADNETEVNHPVYNLTMSALERMLRWSYGQPPQVGIEEVA